MREREAHACHGGHVRFLAHDSVATASEMRFGVFVPAGVGPFPVLFCLAGLTCDETTFLTKSGAIPHAAAAGLMLVAPDTSPRTEIPGDRNSWDFGIGAGFYLDATRMPWATHYRMGTYVADELPALIERQFPALPGVRAITGHSMGGHGALVTALRAPERWRSVSAFAPIAAPSEVPWGEKAFSGYLGPDRAAWAAWDARALMLARPHPSEVLVDQGESDQFLATQLRPERLEATGQSLRLRKHVGFDHSYWFIQTVIADHVAHHAAALSAPTTR